MNARFLLSAAMLALMGWLAPLGAASADQVLLNTSGIITGEQSFVDSFTLATAGTLTVTLIDIGSPGDTQDLHGWVTSANDALTPMFGPGTESIAVGPGLVSMHWVGEASGALPILVFGLELQFQPSGTVVPLPMSLLLLASGLALMVFWQRGRRESVPA